MLKYVRIVNSKTSLPVSVSECRSSDRDEYGGMNSLPQFVNISGFGHSGGLGGEGRRWENLGNRIRAGVSRDSSEEDFHDRCGFLFSTSNTLYWRFQKFVRMNGRCWNVNGNPPTFSGAIKNNL